MEKFKKAEYNNASQSRFNEAPWRGAYHITMAALLGEMISEVQSSL